MISDNEAVVAKPLKWDTTGKYYKAAPMFNWDDEVETRAGYTAAIEAVLGLTAQKLPVTENAVEDWLDVSLAGIDEHKHIR